MIMGLLLTQPKRKLLKIIGQFSFSTLLLFCNYYSLVCIVPLNIRFELFCANLISNSKAQPLAVLLNTSRLQYYTNQATAALIDDFLQGFLDFKSRVLWHTIKLVVQALVHKLMQGLSENI